MQENYGDLLNDWYEMFVDGVSLRFDGNKEKTQGIIDNGPYWIVEEAVEEVVEDTTAAEEAEATEEETEETAE